MNYPKKWIKEGITWNKLCEFFERYPHAKVSTVWRYMANKGLKMDFIEGIVVKV